MKRWLAIIATSLLLIYFVYPSAFIYPRDTLPDNNDTRLIAYIIGQVQKNLIEHKPLHYGTFFAPDENTLRYSELFLTSSLITLPFRAFTTHPIIILNIAIIIGFLLTIISSYILFQYLFKNHWITILATNLFNFSGFHLAYLPHLQMFSLWLLILSIYFFIRYQSENRLLFLYLFFLTVTFQLSESIFPAYLIFFSCLIIVISTAVEKSQSTNMRSFRSLRSVKITNGPSRTVLEGLRQIFIRSIPFLPVWLWILFPYLQLHLSFPEATRPIRDAAAFSLGLDEIFTKYHSWTLIILFLAVMLAQTINSFCELSQPRNAWSRFLRDFGARMQMIRVRRKRGIIGRQEREIVESQNTRLIKTIKNIFDPWKYIFFFSFIMSLGPVLKIFGKNIRISGFPIPLPYSLFYYLFPGFQGFRTPSRFIVLALLAAVIIIGYSLKPIFKKLKSKTKLIFILLILSLLLLEADLPLKGYPININMHPVYQQVKNLPPKDIILELPIKLWNMPDHEIESVRSLYSLFHNHRRLGGFSGFATNDWIELVEKINANGLNKENTNKLNSLGITHVIQENQMTVLK